MNNPEFPSLQEENHLKVLRLPEANPRLSQHELADALGVPGWKRCHERHVITHAPGRGNP